MPISPKSRPAARALLAWAAATVLAAGVHVTPVFAGDDTPVPLPCNPEDCGPVPIVLPGCPTCTPNPAPDPGTAPGGPIEPQTQG